MTWFGLPVSTSQAAVGAILGIGFFNQEINLAGLGKVLACWFGTPLGAVLICMRLYKLLAAAYNRLTVSLFRADSLLESDCRRRVLRLLRVRRQQRRQRDGRFCRRRDPHVFQAALVGGVKHRAWSADL